MWQEQIDKGVKQLAARQLDAAESSFSAALNYARENFGQYDHRIPETFSHMGQTLLLQKRIHEATAYLRQSSRIAASYNYQSAPVALADYLWSCIDKEHPEAEDRRKDALKTLVQFLNKSEIAAVNNQLKTLFTAGLEAKAPDTAKSDPPSKKQTRSEAKPEAKSESESKPEPKAQPKQPEPTPPPQQPEPAPPSPKQEAKPVPKPAQPPPKPEATPQPQPAPKTKEAPKPESGPAPTSKKNAGASFTETIAQFASQSKSQDTAAPAAFPAERYQSWAEKLSSAVKRSKSPHITEQLSAYVELHQLMSETLQLYRPPHTAVADHLMAFGDLTNAIGLYNQAGFYYLLAAKNFEKTVGKDHLKTAYANLYLAMVHRDLDQYDQARSHFGLAFNIIQTKQNNLDQTWWSETVDSFKVMMRREQVEKQFLQGLEELITLLKAARFHEFDALSRELSEKLASVFPQDHYNFMLLYRRTAQGLAGAGRVFESIALSNMADYLDAKLKDKENFNKSFDESFPQFPAEVMVALCSVHD